MNRETSDVSNELFFYVDSYVNYVSMWFNFFSLINEFLRWNDFHSALRVMSPISGILLSGIQKIILNHHSYP